MNSWAHSLRRVAVVAGFTVAEAVRHRFFLLLAGAAGAFCIGALWLRELNLGGSADKFLLDAGFSAESVVGSVLAIATTAQLFFAELERGTVVQILARPVRRAEYLAGRLTGIWLVLAGYCAGMTGLLLALTWWSRAHPLARAFSLALPDAGPTFNAGIAWCGWVIWLRLGVQAAMTLLVASYARSSLFTMVAGFLLLMICQLQHLGRGFLGATEALGARGMAELIGIVLPDYQLLDLADRTVAGEPWSGAVMGAIALYGLGYMGAFGCLAAWCFRHRDL